MITAVVVVLAGGLGEMAAKAKGPWATAVIAISAIAAVVVVNLGWSA